MKHNDKKILGLLFGSIFPAILIGIFIIIWYIFDRGTDLLGFVVTIGFLLGLLIDVFYLKKLTKHRYKHPFSLMIIIFIFFNLIALTIGMGVPVLNLILGAIAGYYMANRLYCCKIEEEEHPKLIKKTISLSVGMIVVMVIVSGCIAFANPQISNNFQMVLGLGTLSKGAIVAIIIIGGAILAVSQYQITSYMLKYTYNKRKNNSY